MKWNDKVGDLKYSVGANITFARQKNGKRHGEIFGNAWDKYRWAQSNRWSNVVLNTDQGNAGGVWMWEVIGRFETQEQIDSYPVDQDGQNNATVRPGDVILRDVNGDGIINDFDERPQAYASADWPWDSSTSNKNPLISMGNLGFAREAEESGCITLDGKLIDGSEFTLRALDFRRMEFGNKPTGTPDATITFDTSAQPIFRKNFDMVAESFKEYMEKGYALYICSDSMKQTDRIRAIFEDRGDQIAFTAVERTLHEGFADNALRLCIFTDHQLFDRFHKYNLKSDKARSGKVALSLKELNQFTPGDYVVHTDHGVGRFSGLVRIPNGDTTQEVMKLVYQNEDVVFVSIHSLHKVSKYKGKDGEGAIRN